MEQELLGISAIQAEPVWETECMSAASLLETVRLLRRRVMEFLDCPSSLFTHEELADVELAVGEACTNAFRHGSPRGGLDEMRVKCMRSRHTLVVEVSDDGYGFDPESIRPPAPDDLAQTGMGILLMRSLMDSVEFEFAGGTTVRMVKHCRRR